MALFSTLPAGSGKISPLFPNLVLRWDVDGLGIVFEDTSTNFLLVWNADTVPRAVQYSPGLFTQTLVEHTGELVHPGPQTFNFKNYPQGLGYAWEIERYPTAASSFGFPPSYLDSGPGNNQFNRDTGYITHKTGPERRMVTWPPLRGMRYHPTPAKQAEAFQAAVEWCMTQLCRPLAHISQPFLPWAGFREYISGFEFNVGNFRYWHGDMEVTRPDLDGVTRNWNAFDPAHNPATPQFILTCADHPLGACLIWIMFAWYANGIPAGTQNYYGSLSYPMDQERSIYWTLQLFLQAYLVGIQWADPNLIRDWCGGLKTNGHGNGGLGWRPRDMLRYWTDVMTGPEYGFQPPLPQSGVKASRFIWSGSDIFDDDGQHQPYLGGYIENSNATFQFNGKDYRRIFGSEKAFHRYMMLWVTGDLLRAHDYVKTLDATEDLFDPARVAEVRRWARQFDQYVIDTGFIDDWGGSAKGAYRQRCHLFNQQGGFEPTEKGFESLAALEAGIAAALVDTPNMPPSLGGAPWVYPGTNPGQMNHLFAVQHDRFELGLTLWHIMAGAIPGETEGHECGIPAYACAFGYDANLQASIDKYLAEVSDPDKKPAHYEIVWRAVELANATNLPLGTIKFSTKLAGLTIGAPNFVPLGTIKLAPKFAGLTIAAPPGPILGTIKLATKFAGLTISDQGATYYQLGTIALAPAFAGLTIHTREDPVEEPPDTGGGSTDDGGAPPPQEPPPPPIDGGSIDDDKLGRSLRGPRIPAGLFVGDAGLRLGP